MDNHTNFAAQMRERKTGVSHLHQHQQLEGKGRESISCPCLQVANIVTYGIRSLTFTGEPFMERAAQKH